MSRRLLRKTGEYRINDSDTYFLDVVAGRIVVNDGYRGLKMLRADLAPAANLSLPEEISIYSSYSNSQLELIVLYDPDQQCLVRVSLQNMKVDMIPRTDKSILSPVHIWDGPDLVIASHNRQFYAISGETVTKWTEAQVAEKYPEFYDVWTLSTGKTMVEYRSPLSFVYDGENCLILYQAPGGVTQFTRPDVKYHMGTVQGRYALVVAEGRLDVVTTTGEAATLFQRGSKVYLKARFFERTDPAQFVVLGGDKSDVYRNLIELFEVIER